MNWRKMSSWGDSRFGGSSDAGVDTNSRPGVPVLKRPRTLVRIESPRSRVKTFVPDASRLNTISAIAMACVRVCALLSFWWCRWWRGVEVEVEAEAVLCRREKLEDCMGRVTKSRATFGFLLGQSVTL